MYNYTLELRQIPEVFDFDYDFYDEQFKCNFEEKFIKHYYFNEIGFETVERFKQRLEAKLLLNMPYWTQLYETELAAEDLDFLLNKDLKETFLRTVDTEDKLKGTSAIDNTSKSNSTTKGSTTDNVTGKSTTDTTNSGTSNVKQSNIADGVASVSLETSLLTGVQGQEDSSEGNSTTNTTNESTGTSNSLNEASQTGNTKGTNTEDRNGKLLEKTEFISKGNIGVTSSAELMEKWRKILINIDKIIIDDCYDLFLGIF